MVDSYKMGVFKLVYGNLFDFKRLSTGIKGKVFAIGLSDSFNG